jgi:5'-deoxynucleotidase YfbR-like HD superfamily hydrolase
LIVDNTPLHELIQFGHDVTRWHTMPTLKEQTLADHSWGVAMLVARLYDGEYKISVLMAALEHDLVEKHIGDMPRPGRTDEHRTLENRTVARMGLQHGSKLPLSAQNFLEWADLIEAGLHAMREVMLGNKNYRSVITRVQHMINQSTIVPPPLREFAKEAGLI